MDQIKKAVIGEVVINWEIGNSAQKRTAEQDSYCSSQFQLSPVRTIDCLRLVRIHQFTAPFFIFAKDGILPTINESGYRVACDVLNISRGFN